MKVLSNSNHINKEMKRLMLGWDTHENGHTRASRMKKMIDKPIAQLIKDLDRSGRLDRTLVVLASEFSRDMVIEGRPFYTTPDGHGEVITDLFA